MFKHHHPPFVRKTQLSKGSCLPWLAILLALEFWDFKIVSKWLVGLHRDCPHSHLKRESFTWDFEKPRFNRWASPVWIYPWWPQPPPLSPHANGALLRFYQAWHIRTYSLSSHPGLMSFAIWYSGVSREKQFAFLAWVTVTPHKCAQWNLQFNHQNCRKKAVLELLERGQRSRDLTDTPISHERMKCPLTKMILSQDIYHWEPRHPFTYGTSPHHTH